MITYIHLKSDRNDCFHTLRLKNKQKDGKDFVLFNSYWYRVKKWQVFVDNNCIRFEYYIGKFSTKDQFRIQFVEE